MMFRKNEKINGHDSCLGGHGSDYQRICSFKWIKNRHWLQLFPQWRLIILFLFYVIYPSHENFTLSILFLYSFSFYLSFCKSLTAACQCLILFDLKNLLSFSLMVFMIERKLTCQNLPCFSLLEYVWTW